MKRAQREQSGEETPYGEGSRSVRGALDLTPWIGLSGSFWNEYMKWLVFWQGEVQRMWGFGPTMLALRAPRNGDMRRASDLPWMPRMEAQVIPLRRNTDPPGAEATRFSMRMPLPWASATNVVAVETIVGAGEGTQAGTGTAAPDQHPASAGSEPDRGRERR